jgi:uncharacterized protein (TIGR04222 family)
MPLGPFDMTGGPFLTLYAALLVVTIIAGFIIPRWLRPDGRDQRVTNADDLAVLAGGQTRFIDTVVARLLSVRALEMTGKDGFRTVSRDAGQTTAERSVLALSQPMGWPAIERTLKSYAEPVERRLRSSQLLMDGSTVLQMRVWQTSPYLILIAFGATKWLIGSARDRPVGILTAFLIFTAIFALIRFFAVDRRTRAGRDAVDRAIAQSERLKRAPTSSEVDVAVALFGTAVLVGSGWAAFHALRSPSSSDGGGSSSDGGCGGGGGGGGCGGCGG